MGEPVRELWVTYPTVMLNVVKHLDASLCTNRFLTSFEMTGEKGKRKTILGQPGEGTVIR